MASQWEEVVNREELAMIAAVVFYRSKELGLTPNNPCPLDFVLEFWDPWSDKPILTLPPDSGWDRFRQVVTQHLQSRLLDQLQPGLVGSRFLSDVATLMSFLEESGYIFQGPAKGMMVEVAALLMQQESWEPVDNNRLNAWKKEVRKVNPALDRASRTTQYRELLGGTGSFWQFTAEYRGDYFDPVIRWALQTKPLNLIFKLLPTS